MGSQRHGIIQLFDDPLMGSPITPEFSYAISTTFNVLCALSDEDLLQRLGRENLTCP